MSTVESRLYCPSCGKEGIPIQRKKSNQKEKFHRKKMYCPWCKKTLNFIQVRNEKELEEFKEHFYAGDYEEEVKNFKEEVSIIWQY